jgi:hypothetical protein
MVRRSTPQNKTDDSAFPVRIYLRVPKDAYGPTYNALHSWLVAEVRRGEFAWHSGGSGSGFDRSALYFRHPSVAVAMLAAFPELVLSDGTMSRN